MTEQKAKLSEVEQQLKRAEAAQRRRMQSEKAAREAEVCSSCHVLLLWLLHTNWGNSLTLYLLG